MIEVCSSLLIIEDPGANTSYNRSKFFLERSFFGIFFTSLRDKKLLFWALEDLFIAEMTLGSLLGSPFCLLLASWVKFCRFLSKFASLRLPSSNLSSWISEFCPSELF